MYDDGHPRLQRRRRRTLLLLAGLMLVSGLAVWALTPRRSPAENAAESFVRAAMAGNYAVLAPHLSRATLSDLRKKSPSAKSRFVASWREFLTGGYAEPEQAEFEIDGYECAAPGVARVHVTLVDDDTMLSYIREHHPGFARAWLVMVREDGEWKFDSARTIDRLVINSGYCEENGCLLD